MASRRVRFGAGLIATGLIASALAGAMQFINVGIPDATGQFIPGSGGGGGGGETTTASGGIVKVGVDHRLDSAPCPVNGRWQWTGSAFTCVYATEPRYGWRVYNEGWFASTADTELTLGVSGAGAGVLFGDTDVTRPGVLDLTTGTTTTGRATLIMGGSTAGNSIVLGPGADVFFDTSVKIEVLSDGTNTFTVRTGLNDSISGAGTDGVWFQAGAVNWECVVASGGGGGTSDTEDSGVAIVANTFYRLEFDILSGTNVEPAFRIDGVPVCAATTGRVPNGTARATQVNMQIIGSAGTVNTRTFTWDWIHAWGNFTTPR